MNDICTVCYGKKEISQHEGEDSYPVFIGMIPCPRCNSQDKTAIDYLEEIKEIAEYQPKSNVCLMPAVLEKAEAALSL